MKSEFDHSEISTLIKIVAEYSNIISNIESKLRASMEIEKTMAAKFRAQKKRGRPRKPNGHAAADAANSTATAQAGG